MRKVRRMLELARLTSSDVVYDLGSGDGRALVEAAQKYGARGVGVEVDPIRALWSKVRVSYLRLGDKVRIVWGDFFKQDLSPASVVFVYLWPRTNRRLEEKLSRELRKGARVVSHRWEFEGWTPATYDEETKVYLYVVGDGAPSAV
jgi:predicted RNA methylase